MRVSLVLLAAIGFAVLLGAVPQLAQEQEDVRGSFLTSRPKEKPPQDTNQPSTRPPRRRPKPGPSPAPLHTVGPTPISGNTNAKGTTPTRVSRARIGLGLTLFMRDANGLAVRTDPSHVFRKGDRVRILLETNTDGYLYIFNTTNNGPPVLIYPQVELDEGGNYIEAHVPFEIPSSVAEQERLRWLVFDEIAGDERLYFVFTKEPLKGIPIEDDLIAFCRQAACPIQASAETWAQVQTNLKLPLQSDRSTEYGLAQTSTEKQATTRGLGLSKTDPEPSLIMMASSNTSTLVTALDLIHK